MKKVTKPKQIRTERPGSIFISSQKPPRKEKQQPVKLNTKSTGKMLDDHECLSSETQDDRSEEAVQKKEKVDCEKATKGVENNAPGETKKIETSSVKHFLVNRIQPIKSKVETKSLAQIEMESEMKSIQNQLLS